MTIKELLKAFDAGEVTFAELQKAVTAESELLDAAYKAAEAADGNFAKAEGLEGEGHNAKQVDYIARTDALVTAANIVDARKDAKAPLRIRKEDELAPVAKADSGNAGHLSLGQKYAASEEYRNAMKARGESRMPLSSGLIVQKDLSWGTSGTGLGNIYGVTQEFRREMYGWRLMPYVYRDDNFPDDAYYNYVLPVSESGRDDANWRDAAGAVNPAGGSFTEVAFPLKDIGRLRSIPNERLANTGAVAAAVDAAMASVLLSEEWGIIYGRSNDPTPGTRQTDEYAGLVFMLTDTTVGDGQETQVAAAGDNILRLIEEKIDFVRSRGGAANVVIIDITQYNRLKSEARKLRQAFSGVDIDANGVLMFNGARFVPVAWITAGECYVLSLMPESHKIVAKGGLSVESSGHAEFNMNNTVYRVVDRSASVVLDLRHFFKLTSLATAVGAY